MSVLIEKIGFRNLIDIVEGKHLFEALSDEQKERAQVLIDKYSEIANKLPSQAQEDLNSKLDQLRTGMEASSTDSEEPDTDSEEPDTETPSTEEVVQTLKDAMQGLGTDEGAVYNVLRKLDNKSQWDAVVQQYPEVYDDINGDFSGRELDDVKQLLSNIGVTMPGDSPDEPEQTQTASEPNQGSWASRIKQAGEPSNAQEAAAFAINIPAQERNQYRSQLSPDEQEWFDQMVSGGN
jgi:hypothetical protein